MTNPLHDAARAAKRFHDAALAALDRFKNYRRVWRGRGAAKMDHRLWLFWAVTGRYP